MSRSFRWLGGAVLGLGVLGFCVCNAGADEAADAAWWQDYWQRQQDWSDRWHKEHEEFHRQQQQDWDDRQRAWDDYYRQQEQAQQSQRAWDDYWRQRDQYQQDWGWSYDAEGGGSAGDTSGPQSIENPFVGSPEKASLRQAFPHLIENPFVDPKPELKDSYPQMIENPFVRPGNSPAKPDPR